MMEEFPPPPTIPQGPKVTLQGSQFEMIKNLTVKILIGCLIISAGLAVVAILSGGFSDIVVHALETLGLVMVHAIAALTYVNTGYKNAHKGDLTFFPILYL